MTSLSKRSRITEELCEDFDYFNENYTRLGEMLGENLEKTLEELGGEKSFENCRRILLAYNVHMDLQTVPPYNSGPYVLDKDWSKLDNPNECELATIQTSLLGILEKLEKHRIFTNYK